MAYNLIDLIDDTFPANEDVGVPLLATVWILFDQEMDEDSVSENFFIEGPDTDQFVGPGLLFQDHPNNISQGELDDFLKSPGYHGIVQGEFTFQKIDMSDDTLEVQGSPYRTKAIFTPTQPLVPLTEYTLMLSDCKTAQDITYTGLLTYSFTVGTGSIEEVPTSVSTSVLTRTLLPTALATAGAFKVLSTSPTDHAVEQSTTLTTITIDFNKNIDSSTVTNNTVTVFSEIASDHPNANATALGTLAKSMTVSGMRLTLTV